MVTEFRQGSKLELLFVDNKLIEIAVGMPLEQLCFADKQIGDLDGFYIVKHMMEIMDETPVATDKDLVFELIFPKACLFLFKFIYISGDDVYVLWDYDDRASISLVPDWDRSDQDLSKYIPVPPDPTPW